jgi:hypothetical protein
MTPEEERAERIVTYGTLGGRARLVAAIADGIRVAVAEEREACAVEAERRESLDSVNPGRIAKAIRARGD